MEDQSTTSSASTLPPPHYVTSHPAAVTIQSSPSLPNSPPLHKSPSKQNSTSVLAPSNQDGHSLTTHLFQTESKQEELQLEVASSSVPSLKKKSKAPAKRIMAPSRIGKFPSVPFHEGKKVHKKRKTVASSATTSPSVPKEPRRETSVGKKSRGVQVLNPPIQSSTTLSQLSIPDHRNRSAQLLTQSHSQSPAVRNGSSPTDEGRTPPRSNFRRPNPNSKSTSEEGLAKKLKGIIAKQKLEIDSLKWVLSSLESTQGRAQFPNLIKRNEASKISSILYACNAVSKWYTTHGNQELSVNEITKALEHPIDSEHKMKAVFTFILGTATQGKEMAKKESFTAVMNALLSLISAAPGGHQARAFHMTKKFLNEVFDLCFTAKVHFLWATNFVEYFVGPLMAFSVKKKWVKLYDVVGRCCVRTISNAAKKVCKGTMSNKSGLRSLEVACSAAWVLDKKLAEYIPQEDLRILASKDMMFALHMDSLLER